MKVSKNWLKEYLNLDALTDEELFQKISTHICEIESYKKMVEATNLTIGQVLTCEEHPNSDHLHVCSVEIRPNEITQIVCGAPNVAAGQKVIVANVGAVLPGDFKIKPSKIRGVESNGMLCSLQELGIEEKYIDEAFKSGIQILGEDAEVGGCPLAYLGFDDTIIDLDLTSNRSDLLSIEGVAFDLGAALDQPIATILPQLEEEEEQNPITLEITSKDCYQYHARFLRNIQIVESPQWLKAKLIACGIRPINNVVDITNYVLLEMGQPLHAFDADQLGHHIIVRNAEAGEKLITLDTIERTLQPTDLVIANEQGPVCLAGVMGGLSSEVEATTVNVVLEAAQFDPICIRRTSSRLGLKSESSIRFERKVDAQRVERALDYATQLLTELAGAKVLKGVTSSINKIFEPKTVAITTAKINSVLGTNYTDEVVSSIFDRLAYSYDQQGPIYQISIPSRRMDLEASCQDIIEDVARMNGYDSIPTTLEASGSLGGLTYKQKRVRAIRKFFSSIGFNETVTYSLTAKKNLNLYTLEEKPEIGILMPMTEEKAVMRQSLLNGVLEAIAYNKARKVENISFFEIGSTYSTEAETLKLAVATTGLYTSHLWRGQKQVSDFYVLKGILDTFFEKMNVKAVYKPSQELSTFHPGRTAAIYIEGVKVGIIGELHPRFSKEIGVPGTVALEIDLTSFIETKSSFDYKLLNKFPFVTRDLAIVVQKDIPSEDILDLIRQTARKNLVALELFDVYTGENVGKDEKSLAIKLTLEDTSKTLESADVDKIIKSVLDRLDFTFKAHLRD